MEQTKSPLAIVIERKRDPAFDLPHIIGIDDWMIWGRTSDGLIVETCAEMWPEWLDQHCAPEDMENDEYRKTILMILRHKRPRWTPTFDEHRFADAEEREMIMADLKDLEVRQAAFIAAFK